jgi:Fe2+ or Zn2+ uptake regulation protein
LPQGHDDPSNILTRLADTIAIIAVQQVLDDGSTFVRFDQACDFLRVRDPGLDPKIVYQAWKILQESDTMRKVTLHGNGVHWLSPRTS